MIADLIVAAALLVSGILAMLRGFVKEVLTVAGWIGAIFITAYGYKPLAPLLADIFAELWIAELAMAGILFLFSLVILTILSHMASGRIQGSMLGQLDRALGFVFGLVRGLAFICLLYLVGTLFWDENDLPAGIGNARTLPLVQVGADVIAGMFPEDTFPGREDAGGPTSDSVNGIRKGVEDMVEGMAKEKLEEMIEEIDTEERLRRLNQPEPQAVPEGQAPDDSAAPQGYEDNERSDMQRLIESAQ